MINALASVVLSLIALAMMSLAAVAVPVLMPVAAADLGLTPKAAGIYTAVVYGGAVISSFATAGFLGNWGALRCLQVCLLLGAAGLALGGTGHMAGLLLGAVVLGFGYGPGTPASSQLLALHTPRRLYGLVFSINRVGVPGGIALAGALLPMLLFWLDWRQVLLLAAAALFASALMLQPLRGLDDGGSATPPPSGGLWRRVLLPMRTLLGDGWTRALCFSSVLFFVAQSCLAAFLVVHLVAAAGLKLAAAGLLLSAAQVSGIAVRVALGGAADLMANRLPLLGALGLAMAASAAVLAFVGPATPFWLILAGCLCYGGSALGWNGVMLAELARAAPPGQAGSLIGASAGFTFLGAVIGPAVFALLVALSGGYMAAFLFVALASGGGGLWLLLLVRAGRVPSARRPGSP